ncbi:ABC transporter ATP-binding protein [candidate division KSB1 bacterium]|nr:ABC transporter ATP-binding protein [candidate division KSB1 bacterium]
MLKLENLKFTIGTRQILDDVNLQVNNGEIHAILGQNGTGKTTLGAILMGLSGYQLESGRIIFDGQDITNWNISQRAQNGLTLGWQRPVSFEGITVERYLQIAARGKNSDYRSYLFFLGLEPETYLSRNLDNQLSGGERKRIELAAIWAMNAKLAILDEPDSGIDALSLERIAAVIRKIRANGTTIILITHREEIANIADRASSLCAGRILRTGAPPQIIRYYQNHCRDCAHINQPYEENFDELQ